MCTVKGAEAIGGGGLSNIKEYRATLGEKYNKLYVKSHLATKKTSGVLSRVGVAEKDEKPETESFLHMPGTNHD